MLDVRLSTTFNYIGEERVAVCCKHGDKNLHMSISFSNEIFSYSYFVRTVADYFAIFITLDWIPPFRSVLYETEY